MIKDIKVSQYESKPNLSKDSSVYGEEKMQQQSKVDVGEGPEKKAEVNEKAEVITS